ncbi:replication factor A protein, partial [Trifolium medium]|nr:replication factor A protein [Trifolium medium]
FGKINNARGSVVVEAVENITRVLVNPPIAETVHFRQRILASNFRSICSKVIAMSDLDDFDVCQFNCVYPRKTLNELIHTFECGVFILSAKVVGLTKQDHWFYPICDCKRMLFPLNGTYYCSHCHLTGFNALPKYRFEMTVNDGSTTAVFELFDHVLNGVRSLNFSLMGAQFALTNVGLEIIGAKELIFIVRKIAGAENVCKDVIEVLRVSDSDSIIRHFHDDGYNYTPTKLIFKPHFTDIPQTSVQKCVNTWSDSVNSELFTNDEISLDPVCSDVPVGNNVFDEIMDAKEGLLSLC